MPTSSAPGSTLCRWTSSPSAVVSGVEPADSAAQVAPSTGGPSESTHAVEPLTPGNAAWVKTGTLGSGGATYSPAAIHTFGSVACDTVVRAPRIKLGASAA